MKLESANAPPPGNVHELDRPFFTRARQWSARRPKALPAGDRGRALVFGGRDDQPAHNHGTRDATAVTQCAEQPEQGTVEGGEQVPRAEPFMAYELRQSQKVSSDRFFEYYGKETPSGESLSGFRVMCENSIGAFQAASRS